MDRSDDAESVSLKKNDTEQQEQTTERMVELSDPLRIDEPVPNMGEGVVATMEQKKASEGAESVFEAEPQPEGWGLGFECSQRAGDHEETIENINQKTNRDKQEYDRNANVLTTKHEGLKNSETSNKRSANSPDTDRLVSRKRSKRSPSGETESSSCSTNSTSSQSERSGEKSVSSSAEGPATSDSLDANSIQTEGSTEAAPEPGPGPGRKQHQDRKLDNIPFRERVKRAEDRKHKIEKSQFSAYIINDAEESTLEDYERTPVQGFGMAMLRAMGLKEDAKTDAPRAAGEKDVVTGDK